MHDRCRRPGAVCCWIGQSGIPFLKLALAGSVAFAVISSFFWAGRTNVPQCRSSPRLLFIHSRLFVLLLIYYISIIYLYSLPDVLVHFSCLLINNIYLYLCIVSNGKDLLFCRQNLSSTCAGAVNCYINSFTYNII